jgi:hypothetical protein
MFPLAVCHGSGFWTSTADHNPFDQYGNDAGLPTQPLKRLQHAGRIFIVDADDPALQSTSDSSPQTPLKARSSPAEQIHGASAP